MLMQMNLKFIYFFIITIGWFISSLEFFWILLEMNMVSFVMMMVSKNISMEVILKYFTFQTYASFFLFWIIFFQKMNYFFLEYFFLLIMCLKLGLFPFHLWFLKILKYFEFNLLIYILFFQKLLPFLFLWKFKTFLSSNNFIFFVSIHCLFSSSKMLNANSVKDMLFFSSYLFFIFTILVNFKILLLKIFFIYYVGFHYFMFYLYFFNVTNFNNFFLKKINYLSMMILILLIFNMASIPPFWIFLIKLKLLLGSFFLKSSFVFFLIILGSIFSSYSYLMFLVGVFLNSMLFLSKEFFSKQLNWVSQSFLVIYFILNAFIIFS